MEKILVEYVIEFGKWDSMSALLIAKENLLKKHEIRVKDSGMTLDMFEVTFRFKNHTKIWMESDLGTKVSNDLVSLMDV